MKRRLAALGMLAGALLALPAAATTRYLIDPARSQAAFDVRLLWLKTLHGRFAQMDGAVELAPRGNAHVDARVATGSVMMAFDGLRRWVLSREFFDAAHYPVIAFVSAPVAPATLVRGGTLDGRLTLRGITRPVRFELLPSDCAVLAATGCAIDVRGTVQRSDFGMTAHRATVSDAVQLRLHIALSRAPD